MIKGLSEVQRDRIVAVWHFKVIGLLAKPVGLIERDVLSALDGRHVCARAVWLLDSAIITAKMPPIAGNIGFAANVQRDDPLQGRGRGPGSVNRCHRCVGEPEQRDNLGAQSNKARYNPSL